MHQITFQSYWRSRFDCTFKSLHALRALKQLTSAGSVTFDYYARGNLWHRTSGSNVTTYTYNAADQLTGVSATGINATYGYDADGRRVKQTLGSTVTNFLWDEASPYGDVVYEYNGSGSPLASYVLGGTQLISQTRGSTTSYFLQDGQGSTRALTSSNTPATITDTYSYTAFGEIFNQSGTTTNSYLYTGQQYDSLTGLYSLRARYYNPGLGRFLSQDTYPVNFGNPVELNRYVYGANNPINAMDPSGHLLVEYLFNTAKGAAQGTAVGFAGGFVYGVVASLVCGGASNGWDVLNAGIQSGVQGAYAGAALGALTGGIPGLTPLATVGAGAWGFRSALMHASDNLWCNFLNIGMSVATMVTGLRSTQFYWGGPSGAGLNLCGATCGGGTASVTLAGQGVAGNSGILGGLGGLNMLTGGRGFDWSAWHEERIKIAEEYLKRLPDKHSFIKIRSGEVDFITLSYLQEIAQNEFALVKTSSGETLLIRGDFFKVRYPPDVVNIIAHTHPGSITSPSQWDLDALNARHQESSLIIIGARVIEYFADGREPIDRAPLWGGAGGIFGNK